MARIVLTHRVHEEVLEYLAPCAELIANQTAETLPREEVMRRAAAADALMAFMPDKVDAAFLTACPRLKIVAAALKGLDNFDAAACAARGVWLTVVPDLLTVPTAELTIGLLIGITRQIRQGDGWVRSGQFAGWRPEFYGLGIAGSTIGIVGMGSIGRAVAERLRGWDARVLYTDQTRIASDYEARLGLVWCELSELLRQADATVLALPLTAKTSHLINSDSLRLVKRGGFLVNPCRGSVVDEAAVLGALQSGQLGGYAADVFEMEDWAREDRPTEIAPALLARPDTLFTAHMGSAVRRVRLAIEQRAAANIRQALLGQRPDDAVNEFAALREPVC
ncbi:phosphonate dehydrogenase [Bradyrhizobium sp.]|jgi:phosphonate dehydrogenase|uniref:phosphonate dehydrogenase n=1 Tax=Bradyrhizobium sp. TaxID=376 RepID=UPI00391A8419